MRPEPIWRLSHRLYLRGWIVPAKMLKMVNYLVFRAILPYEVPVGRDLNLWHRGLGLVVHPNVVIGDSVGIGHGVVISGVAVGQPTYIDDGVIIGSKSMILPSRTQSTVIGAGARVGALSLVNRSVPPGQTVAGNPARPTRPSPTESESPA